MSTKSLVIRVPPPSATSDTHTHDGEQNAWFRTQVLRLGSYISRGWLNTIQTLDVTYDNTCNYDEGSTIDMTPFASMARHLSSWPIFLEEMYIGLRLCNLGGAVDFIRTCTTLKVLVLDGKSLYPPEAHTETDLSSLGYLPYTLTDLFVENVHVRRDGLRELTRLREQLKVLSLDNVNVIDDDGEGNVVGIDVGFLSGMCKLEELHIVECPICDEEAFASAARGMVSLKEMKLDDTLLFKIHVSSSVHCPYLEKLTWKDSCLDAKTVARLTSLTELHMRRTEFYDTGDVDAQTSLRFLTRLTDLRVLNLDEVLDRYPLDVSPLVVLTRLEEVTIRHIDSCRGLFPLSHLVCLQTLDLQFHFRRPHIFYDGSCLTSLTNLTYLRVGGSKARFLEEDVELFRGLPDIEELDVYDVHGLQVCESV